MKNDSGRSLDADARAFAIEHHGDMRYNEHPFVFHLDAVAEVLRYYGHDELYGLIAAAYLHDVVEDTPVTIEQVGEEFGSIVRDFVDALTNVVDASKNRRTRQELTHAKLRRIAASYGNAPVNLKLADRIANIEFSLSTENVGKLGMYFTEHAHFEREVAPAGGDPRMWKRLDELVPACSRVLQREKAARKAAKQPLEATDEQAADAWKQLDELVDQGETDLILNMLNAQQVIALAEDWNDKPVEQPDPPDEEEK